MRNKAIFLATTAVALVLMGTPAKAEGLYISAFGGLNWQPGSSGSQSSDFGPTTTVFSEDADTGFVIGGAIGTELQRWVQGLRAEIEVSYRRNDRSGAHQYFYGDIDNDPAEGPIDGNLSNFAVMANLWYEFDIGSKFRPYVGGGAGWARSHLDVAATITDPGDVPSFFYGDITDEEANGFAFQLGAGLNHNVAPGVDVGIGYRYFNGPNFDPIFVGKNNLPVGFENESHSVLVNLTISTN